MKKKILQSLALFFKCCCIISLSAFNAFSQQQKIDSLIIVLKSYKSVCAQPCLNDTVKVNLLNNLAQEISSGKLDTAMILCNEALHLSEKINWQTGIGNSYHYLGWIHYAKGDYTLALQSYSKALDIWNVLEKNSAEKNTVKNADTLIKNFKSATLRGIGIIYGNQGDFTKALDYYFESLKLSEETADAVNVAKNYNNIGFVYWNQGDYRNALNYYFKSLIAFENLNDNNTLCFLLSNIGLVCADKGNYTNALEYYFKALKLDEALGNKNGVTRHLGNIGIVYREQCSLARKNGNQDEANRNYNLALDYNFKAIKMADESGYKQLKAYSLSNIADIYKDSKDYKTAIGYDFKAMEIEQELGNKNSIATLLGNIGSLYTSTKKYAEAEEYLLKSLAASDSIDALELQRVSLKYLSELYEQTGNYKKSLAYYKKAAVAKDSLFNEEKNKEITLQEMNFDFGKKEAATKSENEKKEALDKAEIKRQKVIRDYTLGGVGMAGIFSFLLVWSFNRRRKTAFEKQVSQVEMTALRAQMNPHFIFNSLHSINKYMMDNDKDNASDFLSKFSKLMRLILENSREQEIPLEKDLSALELYMQLESLRFQNKFQYTIEVDPQIDQENVLIAPLLLQPFVENSILHGLRTKEDGRIQIKIKKEDNMIRCSVEDNGIGRQQTVQVESGKEKKRESLGMKITQERLNIINQLKKVKAAVSIFDLKDADNKPGGLRVELMLPFETVF